VPPKNLTPYEMIPDEALVEMTKMCDDVPEGSLGLDYCLLGAPNAGKSSLLNLLVNKNVSASSPRASTTDAAQFGVLTDVLNRTQLLVYDTPGFTRASKSATSKLLVTKAWETVDEVDHALFVVDCAKRLTNEVRDGLKRLK
jgi:GTPase